MIFLISLIGLFIIFVIVRALQFNPKESFVSNSKEVKLNEDRIVQNMSEMIKCKTISYNNKALMDMAPFVKFQNLLINLYPIVHKTCKRQLIGETGILYYWKGKSSKESIVLMSHYDVVPVEEAQWTKPAFAGTVQGGFIWGRGTLDTKGTLCGIFEASEKLMEDGFVPENDIYFSFSGDEEINGSSCPALVSYFQERGIKPAFVLDEGGAVVENIFPGVEGECALVGIGEKGMLNAEFSLKGQGGHASTPPIHTLVGEIASAIVKVENNPFPMEYTKTVEEMFDTLGRYSSFTYKILFANMWCFKGLFDVVCKKSGGELNAMMRTTCAFTKMEGSKAYNVMPPVVSVGMNLRLLGKETTKSAKEYLEKVINNDNINVNIIDGMNPSIESDTNCKEWDLLGQTIKDTWPDAIVSPYLMMACSDSRHYCKITDRVYRFSAMKLSKEERGLIHGNDERVPIETLIKTVKFYVRLISKF